MRPIRNNTQLTASELGCARAGRQIIAGVNITLVPGTITVITGRNGAGKSTLLHGLAGLLAYTGRVHYGHDALSTLGARQRAQWRAYLPQTGVVLESFSVYEVVAMALAHRSRFFTTRACRAHVQQTLAELGCFFDLQCQIGKLSVGQYQQVRLAHVLQAKTPYLFLDEPTAGLDATTQQRLADILQRRCKAGQAILVASHEELFLKQLPGHVLELSGGQLYETT